MTSAIFYKYLAAALPLLPFIPCAISGHGWMVALSGLCAFSLSLPVKGDDRSLMRMLSSIPPLVCLACGFAGAPEGIALGMLIVSVLGIDATRLLMRHHDLRTMARKESVQASMVLHITLLGSCLYVAVNMLLVMVERVQYPVIVLIPAALFVALGAACYVRFYTGYSILYTPSMDRNLQDIIAQENAVRNPVEHRRMSEIYDKFIHVMDEEKPYLKENCNLSDIAVKVYSNKTYLSRSINEVSNMNFCTLVKNYRSRYAMELLLKEPDIRIGELASRSGFHNQPALTSAFKDYYGVTPFEYQQKLKMLGFPSMKKGGER